MTKRTSRNAWMFVVGSPGTAIRSASIPSRTGKQSHAGQLDHHRVGGSFNLRGRTDCGNVIAGHQHRPAGVRPAVRRIEDQRGLEQICRGIATRHPLGLRPRRVGRQQGQQNDAEPENRRFHDNRDLRFTTAMSSAPGKRAANPPPCQGKEPRWPMFAARPRRTGQIASRRAPRRHTRFWH